MKVRVFTGIVLLGAVFVADSQAQRLNIDSYGVEDGLPQSQVLSIHQDSRGYLWFGTYAGVSRYNGSEFLTYDTSNGLKHNTVSNIAEDTQGNLYFATEGGGIAVFDGKDFEYIQAENGLMGNVVYDLQVDEDGQIWVATDGGLTCINNNDIVHYTSEGGLEGKFCSALLHSPSGELWAGTNLGLFLLKNGRFEKQFLGEGIGNRRIYCITRDPSGVLWVGAEGGLFRKSGSMTELVYPKEGISNNLVLNTAAEPDGTIWFGTTGGVLCYKGGKFSLYTTKNGLLNNHVYSVYVDKEENIWFGNILGVNKYSKIPLVIYDGATGLVGDTTVRIFEDSRKRLWIGCWGNGITVFDGDKVWSLTSDDGLPDHRILALAEDPDGNILIGTGSTLCMWDGKKVRVLDRSFGVTDLLLDNQGRMWVSSRYGAFLWTNNGYKKMPNAEILYSDYICSIAEDHSNNIWFSTKSIGVIVYDGTSCYGYGQEDGVSNEILPCLTVDKKGNVWIGSHGDGVFCYDGKNFHNYNSENGLSNNFVSQLFADESGNVWIGTGKGLDLFDGNSFDSLDEYDRFFRGTLVGNAILEDSNGQLFFGTGKGLVKYVPEETFEYNYEFPVYVEQLLVNNEPRDPDQALELNSEQNNLVFHYAGLSYRDEKAVRYRYMIEGLDKNWSEVTPERYVRYRNVPPGTYKFKVEATIGDDIWSIAPATASFTIHPPFYQTYWFMALAIACGALLIASAHHWRVRKVKRDRERLEQVVRERMAEITAINEDLKSFSYSVSHDLRSPLRLIQGFSQILLEESKEQLGDSAREYLEKIDKSTQRMNCLIDDLLKFSRSTTREIRRELVFLSPIVRNIADELQSVNPGRDAEFIIPDGIKAEGDENLLQIALENLIGNAWKFTGKKPKAIIEFGVKLDRKKQVFYVRDNGAGFDMDGSSELFKPFKRLHNSTEFEGTGIGLATVRRIVQRHGGEIRAEGKVGEGATFYFTLKK